MSVGDRDKLPDSAENWFERAFLFLSFLFFSVIQFVEFWICDAIYTM